MNRNFNPYRLNKVWVSDITYIQTNQGWLYLTTIIDLFDRQVIGRSLSTSYYTCMENSYNKAQDKHGFTISLGSSDTICFKNI
ncbi:DDE-type integrase/transposase/recombinase [Zunongwangia sp.]|uniref:DDE-type integrase/transposase/recombinase n=1 Tax=Zunongwangia sp. TaxID=1965325 RepID=UPI003AA83C86